MSEVSLPNLTVTEANPAARMDYRRFQSSQVMSYDALQAEIIRKHSPGRGVRHNMMGFFAEYDHWKLSAQLDFPSWDSYPLGHSEQFPLTEAEHKR